MSKDLIEISRLLSESTSIPAELRNHANMFLTVQAGAELGFPPAASLRMIRVFDGKPILSSDAIAAVLEKGGIHVKLIESTREVATYEATRHPLHGGESRTERLSWTVAMANEAGLTRESKVERLTKSAAKGVDVAALAAKINPGVWDSYREAMLRARCISALGRIIAPDLLAGVYVDGEIQGSDAPPMNAAIAAKVAVAALAATTATSAEQADVRELVERLAGVSQRRELDAVVSVVQRAELTPDSRKIVREAYQAAKARVVENESMDQSEVV
ncbi:MAG: hypothetical protein IPL79_20005 [Myxococcales bacterium]|nr:hypothetical protein [Myxococcales bacterium]